MTDSLNMGKRAFTTAVAAATILWSIGITSFVAPMTAHAASAGSVVRGTTLSTLYYYGSDGSRYAFPNEKTYLTWYSDFSSVETISDSALAAIPLAGNVVYRAGSRWIKIQSDPKTYVVTPMGQIRWIESEEVASGLAGSDWNTMIDDVADTFFVDYTVGTSLTSAAAAFNGAYVSMGGSSYLVDGSAKRMVTSAGASANWLQSRNLLDGSGITLSSLSAGSELSSADAELIDVAQLGTSVTGGLSVSLASDTPAAATIPGGAASVGFTKVKLMASSGSADVSQMVFHLGGIGDTANIEDAFLYEGSVRLTDGRSINSSRDVTFSGLDLSLDSGDSTYVTVKANLVDGMAGGDTANFSLASASSVTSTATVSGSFPVTGSTMTFSATDAGTITVTAGNNPSDPTIGEEGAEIAEIDLAATDEDAWLNQIAFNVDSSSDHSNYKLWAGNDQLASGTVSGDLVTFVLTDSFFVEEGSDETLNVSADVGGESGDLITTFIEETTDVVAVGGDYGFNLQVDIADYDTAGEGSEVAIEGGDLTFANNGPSADDIAVDGNDVVFLEFSLTASNWTEVKELVVNFYSDEVNVGLIDGDAMLEDLAIRESDGSVWMGSEELSTGGDDDVQAITFDNTQTLQAGESLDLMVTADISADATADEVYHVELDMSEVVAEDANGDDLTDVVPTADIVGKDMTVTDSSLDVSASSPPSDGTYVKGSSAVSVAGFNFEAGDANDVIITDLTIDVQGDSDATFGSESDIDVGDHVSQCSLYDNESGSLVDGPESPTDNTGDAELEFENFDWTVEAGETAKLIVKCDFSNTDTDDTDAANDTYAFGISDEDLIVAEDADGEEVEAALGDDNLDGAATTVTISDEGTLTVSLDGSSANSTIILGDSTAVAMSKFKFEADDEAFVINHVDLSNAAGSDEGVSVVKISYTNSAGATETKSGYLSGGIVSFDGMDMYVAADSSATLTVTIDTGSVTTTDMSGDTIVMSFDDVEFEAIGEASGETIDAADVADVTANEMTLRKSKPTLSLASGSPSGAGVAGDSEVFRFNVAADSRGSVTLNTVLFKVVTSDVDGGVDSFTDCDILGDEAMFAFYDADDSSEKLDDAGDWSFADASGAGCASDESVVWAQLDLAQGGDNGAEEIGAGETKTYVLKVDTLGASASDDDAIRIEIPEQDDAAGILDEEAINWSDDEDASIDGDLIKTLPVTGGTIQY